VDLWDLVNFGRLGLIEKTYFSGELGRVDNYLAKKERRKKNAHDKHIGSRRVPLSSHPRQGRTRGERLEESMGMKNDCIKNMSANDSGAQKRQNRAKRKNNNLNGRVSERVALQRHLMRQAERSRSLDKLRDVGYVDEQFIADAEGTYTGDIRKRGWAMFGWRRKLLRETHWKFSRPKRRSGSRVSAIRTIRPQRHIMRVGCID